MKNHPISIRWVLLLFLTASMVSGCKIWDPATWKFRPRHKNVQKWKFETATPYAALAAQPSPADRLVAVSGMGYDGSVVFFTPDGRRVVSESAPADESGWVTPPQAPGPLASLDNELRRERFGQSFAESRLDSGSPAKVTNNAVPAPPDPFAGLPSAIPVPGKPGFVNLPDPHTGLPQIDVRGIASGTPVEVPNPLQPGEKIRFRVP